MMAELFEKSLTLGHGKKHFCKTQRLRWSLRNICLKHPKATCQHRRALYTHTAIFFVSLLSFTFGFSCGVTAAAIVVSDFLRCLVDLHSSRAIQRRRGVPSSLSAIIAVCGIRIVVWLSKNFLIWKFLKHTRWQSLVLENSIGYMGS